MLHPIDTRADRLKLALGEVTDHRGLFSDDAYSEIMQALAGKLTLLDSQPVEAVSRDETAEMPLVAAADADFSTDFEDESRFTPDQLSGIELPFVGRRLELNYLMRLWNDALNEQSLHVITLVGEAGVGKSRMLQEALAQASDRAFRVLAVRARGDHSAPAYSLVRSLVAAVCEMTDTMPISAAEERILRSVRQTYPARSADAASVVIGRLAGYPFADQPAIDLPPLETVALWLRGLAGGRALLLAVDNLHWLDAASLDLLDYLAVALVNKGGLVVATARPEFRQLRPEFLATCACYTEMSLGRLNKEAIRQLIAAVLKPIEGMHESFAEHISTRAAGNPGVAVDFLRSLFETGVFLPVDHGRWRTGL